MPTLSSLIAAAPGDSVAVAVPDGPAITYRELRLLVEQASEALAGAGVGRGDRVAMALPNGPEAVVLFLAAAEVGTACPLNPAYKAEEFGFYLEDTGARYLLVPPGEGGAAVGAVPAGGRAIEVEIDRGGHLSMTGAGSGRRVPVDPPTDEDIALVLHTSGTTSRPKRVPLKHRNLEASVRAIVKGYGLDGDDVSLCVMPLFHVHGLVASTLATLASGGTVVTPRKFGPLAFWPLAQAYRPTWFTASPTPHQLFLMRAPAEVGAATERIRFVRSCSSALSPAQMAAMEARFGVPVLEAYGMTEASHQMASNPLPPAQRRPGSVGLATGIEIGIMDGTGDLLGPSATGEVVIRGASVIDGYESNPEANAASFTSGWFRTGDQGSLDPRGYLSLAGRIKELINRGGEKIAPREVDEVLESHPAVAEAVTFGIPHQVWGEEVAAAVVLRAEATEKALIAYCRERLADFKVPKSLFIVDEIPKTPTGKIQRRFVAQKFTPS